MKKVPRLLTGSLLLLLVTNLPAQTSNTIQFVLIDADTDKAVSGYSNLTEGQSINLSHLKGKKLSIEAKVLGNAKVKSIKMTFGSITKTENDAPYSVFGDSNGDFRSGQLPIGNIKLEANAYSSESAKGTILLNSKINLKISNDGGVVPPVIVEPPVTGNTDYIESDGKVLMQLETKALSSANKSKGWVSETQSGATYIVYRGDNHDFRDTISGISADAKLSYTIKIASPGTFKFFFNSRREPNGSVSDDGKNNDIFIGINGIQSYEKVFTNLPRGQWSLGGRVDRKIDGKTVKMVPEYKFSQAGIYTLEIMPRSPEFKLDYIQLERLNTTTPPEPLKKSCGTVPHGGNISVSGYATTTVPAGQTCEFKTIITGTCNDGVVNGNGTTVPTLHASCSIESGGGGVLTGELGAISSALVEKSNANIMNPKIYFGKFKRNDDGTIKLKADGTSEVTNGGSNHARGLGAGLVLATASFQGTTSSDAKLLEYIRFLIIPGREPLFNGGYNSQHEIMITSMFSITKRTPRVWNQLTSAEKAKIDLLMEASLIANAFVASDISYGNSSTKNKGIDGDSNIFLEGNPNYREGIVGSVIAGISYFGVTGADAILDNFNYANFKGRLAAGNVPNTYGTWTHVLTEEQKQTSTSINAGGAWRIPSASDIEKGVRAFKYKGSGVSDFMKMYKDLATFTYGNRTVSCGMNNGAGSGGCGKIASGCETIPNKGKLGMILEFDSNGRSAMVYAYDVFKSNQATQLALISSGLWNKSIAQSSVDMMKVGHADVVYKLQKGYLDRKSGQCSGTWSISDVDKGLEFNAPLWTDVLSKYHSGTSGGTNTGGGTDTGGGTEPKKSCGSTPHGSDITKLAYAASAVNAGESCTKTTIITGTCNDGNIIAKNPAYETCTVLPPVVAGKCSCERPVLAAGVIPSASTAGACGPVRKTYSSSLEINDAFVAANGNVIDGISVNGAISVVTSGVTLCNFRAQSVKIGDAITKAGKKAYYPVRGVVVQDGTIDTNDSGVLVNFATNSSGLVTRVVAMGGSADGIRVGITATGGSQMVTQSYFTEVARGRDSAAHADLVQTYPVPGETSTSYPVVDGNTSNHSAIIKQNYFKSASYSGVSSGIAVNATWMAMYKGARFEDNYVDMVNAGFWLETSRVDSTGNNPVIIQDNTFNKINSLKIGCSNSYGKGLVYKGNKYATGKAINECQ